MGNTSSQSTFSAQSGYPSVLPGGNGNWTVSAPVYNNNGHGVGDAVSHGGGYSGVGVSYNLNR